MSKDEIRDYLNSVKKYVKVTVVAKECGIPASNLTAFLKDECNDTFISNERLERIVSFIQNEIV